MKNPKLPYLALGVLLVLLLLNFDSISRDLFPVAAAQTVHFEDNGKTISPDISIEIAATEGERALGLMYRKSLPEKSGMLFIFPDEAPRSFWMKNTYVPLDMIFLNAKMEVVSQVENATPLTESPRESHVPAKYVLEVAAGRSAAWGVGPTAKLVGLSK